MLTSIRIQNFRSIRDAQVKLGQVNLFIGPNNSGKSNFLKGIELVLQAPYYYPHEYEISEDFFYASIQRCINNSSEKQTIFFELITDISFGGEYFAIPIVFSNFDDKPYRNKFASNKLGAGPATESLKDYLQPNKPVTIYRPDPAKFQASASITNETNLSSDASNLVSYLFYLSQNFKMRFRQLEADLEKCVGGLTSISTPADPIESGKLKLKFFDQNDNSYWANEVSEGVLYFLAILCIIHQPNSPKLLLLEEPEKGIHPRRIREVMDFIFELARQRDIQIILTSHSPYVVDYFKDIPSNISVFDRENGETVVRNAGDLIVENNARLEEAGEEPIQYTNALGEYWVSGFLGGVPV
ncbi:MAG: chromosome segregation protein SMC [Hymenobacter sp.]|nr:MAG: chromosome segregation protein SMC [Hymenobacter sp.]